MIDQIRILINLDRSEFLKIQGDKLNRQLERIEEENK